jgi:CDP-diacylglycerol--glycerol-3-phosphate 3-phosphatidyltransferase
MEKSILKTVFFYAAVQILCMLLLSAFFSIPFTSLISFIAISISIHILLVLFLLKFKMNFFNLSTGKALETINLANRITLLRISSLPTIAMLLRHKEMAEIKIVLPILLCLVFLTDSFDGQIARRKQQITRMGAMLDSISDYLLIGVISIVYFCKNIVPSWFFLLIIMRLFLQALGMLLFILMKKPVEIKSTWGGKITIATTMTLYVLELVKLYLPAKFTPVFTVAEYASGAVVFLLYFEKGLIFLRHGKKITHDKKHGEN